MPTFAKYVVSTHGSFFAIAEVERFVPTGGSRKTQVRGDPMTVLEVRARVEEIRALANDGERAHSLEDQLHRDVLRAIASGIGGDMLAAEALKTLEIEFSRWCS